MALICEYVTYRNFVTFNVFWFKFNSVSPALKLERC